MNDNDVWLPICIVMVESLNTPKSKSVIWSTICIPLALHAIVGVSKRITIIEVPRNNDDDVVEEIINVATRSCAWRDRWHVNIYQGDLRFSRCYCDSLLFTVYLVEELPVLMMEWWARNAISPLTCSIPEILLLSCSWDVVLLPKSTDFPFDPPAVELIFRDE